MSKCTAIKKLETISADGDLLEVTIDDKVSAYWIYDYSEALQYVDQEVIVEYRQDIYKGNLATFIATFTIPTCIATLDKQENFKLYLDQVDDISNVCFNDIVDGDEIPGCIVYCSSCEYKSSSKASWMELLIRDHTMHVATLRLFDYANHDADFSGKYIKTSLSKNQYGYQSDLIIPMEECTYVNKEVSIAEQFVKNYFSNDPVALQYMERTKVLEYLLKAVDYEPGYGMVRLAMELSLVDSMNNITKDVNLEAIGQALLLRRGYLTQASVMSHSVSNVMIGWNYMFPDRRIVMQLLDDSLEEKPVEFSILTSITKTVNALLEVRKGAR